MKKVFSALLGLLLILCISGNLAIAEQNRTSGIFLHTSHFLLEKTAVNPAPRLDFPVYFSKNASDLFKPIFDKEKEQNRLREAQLIGEIGTQVSDIVRAEGEIAGLKAKQDPEALAKAKEALQKEGKSATDEAVAQRAYDDAMKQYGTGSDIQRAIQAATAAAQGLAGGDVGKIVAGAGSPYVAEIIGKMTDGDSAANAMAHAALGAMVAYLNDNSALAGAAGAVAAEKLAPLIVKSLYPDKELSQLNEQEKQAVVALSTLAAGIAGGLAGNSTSDAVSGAQTGQNAVMNNFLGDTSSAKLESAIEKINKGDKSLQTAKELIELENADKRSDALVAKFTSDPAQMTEAEHAEMSAYLRIYASEMQKEYGQAVTQELITGLLSGDNYMKRAPDTEAMEKAQSILSTWGYHKSNASIADPILALGSGALGNFIKGGALLHAGIGTGVNTGFQLSGDDPFSYVDVIIAGVTAVLTKNTGVGSSAVINMGGAAIGSGIKGEDPTSSIIGSGIGSVVGSGAGKVITDKASTVVKETTADLIGTTGGSVVDETFSNSLKETLDKASKTDE